MPHRMRPSSTLSWTRSPSADPWYERARMAGPNQRYHDRIAARYDDVYGNNAYWELYHELSWRALKPFLPRDQSAPVLDAGCGTGLYGLKLAKSRFRVCLSDLSQRMLDVAQRKAEALGLSSAVRLVQADLQDLAPFTDGEFSLLVAQGDPLSFVSDWRRALRSIHRVLRPHGVAVLSVDSRLGGCDAFLQRADFEGLRAFLESGDSEWLADRKEERFPLHAFTPQELREGLERAGFEVLSLIGKTVFADPRQSELLEDAETRARVARLETEWNATEFGLSRAHHLQVAARRRD